MKSLILASIAALSISTAAQADTRPPLERMPPVIVDGKPLPFSTGVRAGDMLYLSGDVGIGPDGTLPAGIEAQAKQTLDNIGASLKKAGLGWKHVTRCMVLLSDMANWPAFNRVYAAYVDPKNLPARSAFGTNGLALGALVEVQCDAYSPPPG